MSGFDIDFSDFERHLTQKTEQILEVELTAMHDTTDDLARISSNIAPILKSTLRKSVDTKVRVSKAGNVIGWVTFSAVEDSASGRFNYALWTHEQDYELGPVSRGAPGTDGYEVGNKYLERPLKGESEKYIEWVAEAIRKELG
jgi:hypothetical protein